MYLIENSVSPLRLPACKQGFYTILLVEWGIALFFHIYSYILKD